ncbi:hypothetical protein E4U13_004372 [Claviceps humidiphila]|uniref:Uncharacterized protein n=1 Tax=Claviceps humidiphila TaxID=1294629 RepID=A0A9P7TVV3_9HYPO|nr:hypothetical protein E4U13_004372 [Claviceps humidiphila]
MDKIARNLSKGHLFVPKLCRAADDGEHQDLRRHKSGLARIHEYLSCGPESSSRQGSVGHYVLSRDIAVMLFRNSTFTAPNVINKIDPNLKTLFYKIVPEADDPVLAAIPTQILQVPAKASRDRISYQRSQKKRNPDRPRIWKPVQPFPIRWTCRNAGMEMPRTRATMSTTLVSAARASKPSWAMAHLGSQLVHVNDACRHISQHAFEHVFNEKAVHPELITLELSSREQVNRDIY